MKLSAAQHRQISQECAAEICNQQKKLRYIDHSLVLQEFPHLKARHDRAIDESNHDMENNVKSVNEFYELSQHC